MLTDLPSRSSAEVRPPPPPGSAPLRPRRGATNYGRAGGRRRAGTRAAHREVLADPDQLGCFGRDRGVLCKPCGVCPRRTPTISAVSALRAHTKAPYKTNLHSKTLMALNRPGAARTEQHLDRLVG